MLKIAGLEEPLEKYLAARGTDPAPPLSRPDLLPVVGELDKIYWRQIEELCVQAATHSPDRLVFNKYERLVIDLGLLDLQLLKDVEKARVDLVRELYAPAPANFAYFSEWLAQRYRTFTLYGRLESGGEKKSVGAAAVQAPPADDDDETKVQRARRNKIYDALKPLFENLPGFPAQATQLLFCGRLDQTLENLLVRATRTDDAGTATQLQQIMDLRARMLHRARDRCRRAEELQLFDRLEQLDRWFDDKLAKASRPAGAAVTAGQVGIADRLGFVRGELKLVKSLLRLGLAGSGLTKTACLFLDQEPRTTKEAILPVLRLVKECDPALPGTPNLLIAPYTGTGFYEWDRDTVFLPLAPTRSVDEAVVTALANYRFMLDNLHEHGRLKRAFEVKFGKGDFRGAFIRDYRNWVLGVGKGFRGALPADAYDFFRQHIGPSPDDLFAPSEIARLSPEERTRQIAELRRKANRGEAAYQDHFALAVLLWKEARPSDSLSQLAAAVKMYPVDGRSLYALGHVCVTVGFEDKARDAFDECLSMAPNTIWHVFAQDALNRLR